MSNETTFLSCFDNVFNTVVNCLCCLALPGQKKSARWCLDTCLTFCCCLEYKEVVVHLEDENRRGVEGDAFTPKHGDLLLVGRNKGFEKVLEIKTNTIHSHAIMILEFEDEMRCYEANTNSTINGLGITPFEERLEQLKEEYSWVFVLRLSEKYMEKMNTTCTRDRLRKFLDVHQSAKYDLANCIRVCIEDTTESKEDLTKNDFIAQKNDFKDLMCSELCAALYQVSGILPKELNCSALSPKLLQFPQIYQREYIQLFGEERYHSS